MGHESLQVAGDKMSNFLLLFPLGHACPSGHDRCPGLTDDERRHAAVSESGNTMPENASRAVNEGSAMGIQEGRGTLRRVLEGSRIHGLGSPEGGSCCHRVLGFSRNSWGPQRFLAPQGLSQRSNPMNHLYGCPATTVKQSDWLAPRVISIYCLSFSPRCTDAFSSPCPYWTFLH